MSVPNRVEAAGLLLSLQPPPWHLRHSRAVAEIAGWLAARIAEHGIPIDTGLVESAALLHDLDKILPPDDPAYGLPHGDGGADWLTRHGHGELARAVMNHPVGRLGDGERYRRWAAFATREERIVAYADKRASRRLESLADRFARWERKHPPVPDGEAAPPPDELFDARGRPREAPWTVASLARIRERAERLEADVCRAADCEPDEVRRLHWTKDALAEASAEMAQATPA